MLDDIDIRHPEPVPLPISSSQPLTQPLTNNTELSPYNITIIAKTLYLSAPDTFMLPFVENLPDQSFTGDRVAPCVDLFSNAVILSSKLYVTD